MEKREPTSLLGLASGLVDPAPADVPHPFYHIMVTVVQLWLKDFQVAHLQPRGCKWDLLRKGKAIEHWNRGVRCSPYTNARGPLGYAPRNGHQEPLFPSLLPARMVTDSSGFKGNFRPLALPLGWPHVRKTHMSAWDREHSNLCNSREGRRDWTDQASLRLAAPWKADRDSPQSSWRLGAEPTSSCHWWAAVQSPH